MPSIKKGSHKDGWFFKYHELVGGIEGGLDCCSPYSVTFHHMYKIPMAVSNSPINASAEAATTSISYMQYMEHQLYHCRGEEQT